MSPACTIRSKQQNELIVDARSVRPKCPSYSRFARSGSSRMSWIWSRMKAHAASATKLVR